MSWQVQLDLAKFSSEIESVLLEHEAHNNMLLQALSRSLQTLAKGNAGFRDNNGSVALLFNGSLIFNQTAAKSVSDLLPKLESFLGDSKLRMVMGAENVAREFVRTWLQRHKSQTINHEFSMVLQKLDKVQEVKKPVGQFRRAWIEEASLLATWLDKFWIDTGVPNDSDLSSKDMALQMIHSQQLFVWGNNRPAAMVAIGGSTPKGIRVHSVYTPPDNRGKGLARATVAALSKLQLSQGKEFLVLYSDAVKPENAALYKEIGYQPIANHFTYFFKSK